MIRWRKGGKSTRRRNSGSGRERKKGEMRRIELGREGGREEKW